MTQATPKASPPKKHHGLTSAEVDERRQRGEVNEVANSSSRSLWSIVRTNVFTLFNAIVFSGFGLLLALGRWQDALFGFPALFNTLIGVTQEFNAKRTLDRLAVLNAPHARVIRDGHTIEIPLEQVVLDDTIVLRTGDQLVADAVLIDSDNLELDESLLTGESDSIHKQPGDEVLSGSGVVSGSGVAKVNRVGADSYAAALTAEARQFSLVSSELRTAQNKLLKWITWALAPMIIIIVNGQMMAVGGWEVALREGLWRDAAVGGVAAVIAMIPLGLVLVTSIAFAAGGVKLAQKQVLIQELPAVEGLARVDVLCLDKTGTLTTGEIVFDRVVELSQPGLSVFREQDVATVLAWYGADELANPTACSLAEAFSELPSADVVATVPFSSARKWSSVSFSGELLGTWILGAPEMMFAGNNPANAQVLAQAGALAARGERTLALAFSQHLALAVGPTGVELPDDVTPVALLTFREQVRPDAAQTLRYFAEQGVGIRVISGDDPRTVAEVARKVGLEVTEGFDARELPDDLDELAELLEDNFVFGRVTPAQKKSMVLALKSRGHVVAMTGDGVNDALAIKEADLGIAMDTASQATKAVARLVLLDGRFDRMPGVVAEGRRVIANIERVSMLFLTKTAYAFAMSITFGLLMWGFPFLPRQLSITDGLTIGIPAFFLALMPNVSRYRQGFLRRSLSFAIPAGLIVTVALLSIHISSLIIGGLSVQELQSASTLTLAFIAIWVLVVISRPLNGWRVLIIASMYVGLALVWVIPLSREFFEITWLSSQMAIITGVVSLVGMALVEILRAWHLRFIRDPREPKAPSRQGA
jgi:cation-transporting ATPase E